jgi:hypothetical protein
VTFEGNLADDPQVRFTPSGKQVTELTVLVNKPRQNSDPVTDRLRPLPAKESTGRRSGRNAQPAEPPGRDEGTRKQASLRSALFAGPGST